jgi:hypothetical protein
MRYVALDDAVVVTWNPAAPSCASAELRTDVSGLAFQDSQRMLRELGVQFEGCRS